MTGQRASVGTQKTFSARYSSFCSGSAPSDSWSSTRWECSSSKASEMYFRKMSPGRRACTRQRRCCRAGVGHAPQVSPVVGDGAVGSGSGRLLSGAATGTRFGVVSSNPLGRGIGGSSYHRARVPPVRLAIPSGWSLRWSAERSYEVDPISWTGLRVSQSRVRVFLAMIPALVPVDFSLPSIPPPEHLWPRGTPRSGSGSPGLDMGLWSL